MCVTEGELRHIPRVDVGGSGRPGRYRGRDEVGGGEGREGRRKEVIPGLRWRCECLAGNERPLGWEK